MKKLLSILMPLLLVLSLTACNKGKVDPIPSDPQDPAGIEDKADNSSQETDDSEDDPLDETDEVIVEVGENEDVGGF